MYYLASDEQNCEKESHNKPIECVILTKGLKNQDRILCSQCLYENPHIADLISVTEAKQIIAQKLHSINTQMKQNKLSIQKDIKVFIKNIIKLKSSLAQWCNDILIISQEWTNNLQSIQIQSHSINFLEGIELLVERVNLNQLYDINISNLTKIEEKFSQLSFGVQNCKDEFVKFKNKQQFEQQQEIIIDTNQQSSLIQVELINSIRLVEWSYALSFNYLSSILVTGCREEITVWQFDKGKLIKQNNLKGHIDTVLCLVFSKKLNWFVSGSCDQTIRCWKEEDIGQWKSSKYVDKHRNVISCLIINNNEDQLLSCGWDATINVWKINIFNNEIEFDYSLEQQHTEKIFSIALNQSETLLVSCSKDKKIILWVRGLDQKWTYQSFIRTELVGFRIAFVSENQFIWLQKLKGVTHIFEINNGELNENLQQKLTLDEIEKDEAFSPTIQNIQRSIIIQKHGEYIYILQKLPNGNIIVNSDPIYCDDIQNFCALSPNGEYLAIWGQKNMELRIYNILYE